MWVQDTKKEAEVVQGKCAAAQAVLAELVRTQAAQGSEAVPAPDGRRGRRKATSKAKAATSPLEAAQLKVAALQDEVSALLVAHLLTNAVLTHSLTYSLTHSLLTCYLLTR